jgi:hypothetical protein
LQAALAPRDGHHGRLVGAKAGGEDLADAEISTCEEGDGAIASGRWRQVPELDDIVRAAGDQEAGDERAVVKSGDGLVVGREGEKGLRG